MMIDRFDSREDDNALDADCPCDWDVGEHCEECEMMYLMVMRSDDDDQ